MFLNLYFSIIYVCEIREERKGGSFHVFMTILPLHSIDYEYIINEISD